MLIRYTSTLETQAVVPRSTEGFDLRARVGVPARECGYSRPLVFA